MDHCMASSPHFGGRGGTVGQREHVDLLWGEPPWSTCPVLSLRVLLCAVLPFGRAALEGWGRLL